MHGLPLRSGFRLRRQAARVLNHLKAGMNKSRTDFGDQARQNRQKTDNNRITQEFTGKSSGLSKEAQDDLKLWESMFNIEVHNATLTWTQDMQSLHDRKEQPKFGPSRTEDGYVIYQNRSAELGWMLVRLLPFIQPYESALGTEWITKRKALDDAFHCLSEDLSVVVKRRIGASFIELMDKKFNFKDPFFYFESTYRHP
jgi:hypothetical protein